MVGFPSEMEFSVLAVWTEKREAKWWLLGYAPSRSRYIAGCCTLVTNFHRNSSVLLLWVWWSFGGFAVGGMVFAGASGLWLLELVEVREMVV